VTKIKKTFFYICVNDGAVNRWRDRRHQCIRAEGGHFEHRIKKTVGLV